MIELAPESCIWSKKTRIGNGNNYVKQAKARALRSVRKHKSSSCKVSMAVANKHFSIYLSSNQCWSLCWAFYIFEAPPSLVRRYKKKFAAYFTVDILVTVFSTVVSDFTVRTLAEYSKVTCDPVGGFIDGLHYPVTEQWYNHACKLATLLQFIVAVTVLRA